jgi:uncharacterized OB-fold protein
MARQVPVVDYLVLDDGPAHLVAHECTQCGARFLDRRNACAACAADTFVTRPLCNRGTVRAFTVVHRAPPGVHTPFVATIVDLDDGGTVKANLLGVPPDPADIDVGMRVALTTFVAGHDAEGTEAVAFAYEPI